VCVCVDAAYAHACVCTVRVHNACAHFVCTLRVREAGVSLHSQRTRQRERGYVYARVYVAFALALGLNLSESICLTRLTEFCG